MTFRELVRELECKYSGEEYTPNGIIENIRERMEESGLNFKIEIEFGQECGWYEQGYYCPDYEPHRSWYAEDLPEEIGKREFGIYTVDNYTADDSVITVSFIGYPRTNEEIAEKKRYAEYWRNVRMTEGYYN